MNKKYFIITIIIICLAGLNNIYYKTYHKTENFKNNGLMINDSKMEPQKLFETTARLIERKYIEPDLNHQNWKRWIKHYQGQIQTNDDAKVAIDTMIASLNEPYTHFLSKEEFSQLNTSIVSKIYGIGVNIFNDSGKITIFSVMPDTPAQKAELKPNDIILKVNGTECSGKKLDDVAALIKCEKGSLVMLEIKREKSILTKELQRDEIKIKTIESSIDGEIGYINLTSFLSSDMKNELEAALEKTKDCKGLLIDLRWNTGGLLDNAVATAEKFIDSGTIVSIVSRNGYREEIKAGTSNRKIHKPIVIIINEASASASEIFSGALKDYNLATLVGHKSFGKGMVQSVIPLPNETGINLTIAKYLTPKNHDINNLGITPHIIADSPKEIWNKENDTQLKIAKETLSKLISANNSAHIQ